MLVILARGLIFHLLCTLSYNTVLGHCPVHKEEECFSHYKSSGPLNINITIGCNNYSVIEYIDEILYKRPTETGDSICTSNEQTCCSFNEERVCVISMEKNDQEFLDVKSTCQNSNNCTFTLSPKDMSSCRLRCSFGFASCWSRTVKIGYVCQEETVQTYETSTVLVTDISTTEYTSEHTTVGKDSPRTTTDETPIISTTDISTTEFTSEHIPTKQLLAVATANNQCTNKGSHSIVGLAVAVPVSLVVGIVGTVIYFRFCLSSGKAKEKPHPNIDDTVPMFDLNADKQYADGTKKTSSEPDFESVHTDMDSNKKYGMLNGSLSETEMVENEEYVVSEQVPEGTLNTGAESLNLTDNVYYEGGEQAENNGTYDRAGPLDRVGINMDLEDNPYYDGTDGVTNVDDTEQSPSAGNSGGHYTYTYGHFELEGRQRENK